MLVCYGSSLCGARSTRIALKTLLAMTPLGVVLELVP